MIYAVVARGGRPDLAGEALNGIGCPVLLLAGSRDLEGISMAQSALQQLPAKKKLQLVHGSGDRLEDEAGLQEVCKYTVSWFIEHLPAPSRYLRRRTYVS
jgi:putative phosphoribosyl transferase